MFYIILNKYLSYLTNIAQFYDLSKRKEAA
jgi:hypothetical protein